MMRVQQDIYLNCLKLCFSLLFIDSSCMFLGNLAHIIHIPLKLLVITSHTRDFENSTTVIPEMQQQF